jgi:hypothetical protein
LNADFIQIDLPGKSIFQRWPEHVSVNDSRSKDRNPISAGFLHRLDCPEKFFFRKKTRWISNPSAFWGDEFLK